MAHIRIALSQFRPNKGEYAENVARIGAVVTQAAQLDPKPDLVVFPETATSGYFVEGGVKELAVTAGTPARGLSGAYRGAPPPLGRRVFTGPPKKHTHPPPLLSLP